MVIIYDMKYTYIFLDQHMTLPTLIAFDCKLIELIASVVVQTVTKANPFALLGMLAEIPVLHQMGMFH